MKKIQELHPQEIWKYFHQITQIPRPSKKEEKIIQYLVDFAQEHHLEADLDSVRNMVIRKPASPGMENLPVIVLQSHLDMVCEKNNDIEHNFEVDPINAYIEDDWVKAKGTTLGGDDGIGIAASLAILASKNIEHGPLECFFTVDEETGMSGAFGLQPGFLKGKTLLNLDSEDEGELFIGCAGGMDTEASLIYKNENVPASYYACKISVFGLNGGHSGDDINKGLGNSNKILINFLHIISEKTDLRLSEFNGGNLRNAIAREAWAVVCIPSSDKELIRKELNIYTANVQEEFKDTEKYLNLDLGTIPSPEFVIDKTSQSQLFKSLHNCPHGMIEMSKSIEGLVETSTNLASVKFAKNNHIIIATSQRSSNSAALKNIANKVGLNFTSNGASIKHTDGYPGWNPKLDSEILKVAEKSYLKLFGEKPKVKAIHAGLECGLFLTKYPYLDMVSFGPTIKGAHSPDERMEIKSVQKFWDLLIEILKSANEIKV